ncbi:MAG: multicopper oxidase domain-containing protein [Actinomycetota bacterium]
MTLKPTRPATPATRRRWLRRGAAIALGLLVVFATVVFVVIPAFEFEDPARQISVDAPSTRPLMVPPLMSGTVGDGVRRFDLSIGPSSHRFFDGAETATYAYNDASILGPTLEVWEGESVAIDVVNELDEVTTTHWHGGDVPAAADGGPHSTIRPGETWSAAFEVIQPAATLWYHPHRMDLTAEQVYNGAAGLLIVRDDNPLAAGLPTTYGVDDIPVVLQDRNFTPDNQLDFSINPAGRGNLMETLTVNGTIDPYIDVPTGLVRLRLLNGSQARIYRLSVDGSTLVKIASDGGYLEAPVVLEELILAPGDRAEVVVEIGDRPVNLMDTAFERVLELRPNGRPGPGSTSMPSQLAEIDRIPEAEITVDRTFVMEEVGDGWGINGQRMDMGVVNETVRFGATERWRLTVENGQHVFHVHQTQFQILSINGEPPPPEDAGWEDSVWVNGSREVVIAARFDTYTNPVIPYMFHCHLLDHEDLGMMGQFKVIDPAAD